MYRYVAYGLNLHSDLPLPELAPGADGPADFRVRLGAVAWRPDCGGEVVGRVLSEEISLHYAGVATFALAAGREIVVDLAPGADPMEVRTCLLGPVLAGLLHQRGMLVLHASAVALSHGAVAFVGHAGWGKSTMAAYLQSTGKPLLSDDVVALDLVPGEGVFVRPGFPQVKLWPDSVGLLGHDAEALPLVRPHVTKRALRLATGFPAGRVPLRRIYVLDVGDRPSIEPVAPGAGFAHLVTHSYLAKHLRATGAERSHFAQCSEVARSVPVTVLRRPRVFSSIAEVARLVEAADASARAGAAAAEA